VRLEPCEQFFDAGQDLGRLSGTVELNPQMLDVAEADGGDQRVVACVRMAREREELPHDLGVGLPIEAVGRDRSGRTRLVAQRAMNGASSGAIGPEERTVDVEQDELHAGKI